MEILVTIVAFWLILVGAYGVYSLFQGGSEKEETPFVKVKKPAKQVRTINTGPFAPLTVPESKAPSFLVDRPSVTTLPRPEEPTVAAFEARDEDEVAEPRRREPVAAGPRRREPSEVDFLRAQVEHLRSEVYALSSNRPERFERPQQRRYRTGNYTHLPRTLKRQVNEVRGYRQTD